jgi:hypothetical protein
VQADLPADMKAMPMEEQAKVIEKKQKERSEISKRIVELSGLRKAELDKHEKDARRRASPMVSMWPPRRRCASRWRRTRCRTEHGIRSGHEHQLAISGPSSAFSTTRW